MSALVFNLSIAASCGAIFLFMVLALDYIVRKRSKRKRSRLYTTAAKQGYQELEVSKN